MRHHFHGDSTNGVTGIMKSCPKSSHLPLMVVASSAGSHSKLGGRGEAPLIAPSRSMKGMGRPMSREELCESWIASTFRDSSRNANSSVHKRNHIGQYLHQLNAHLKKVKLVSSCLRNSSRSESHGKSVNDSQLEGLQITGLRPKRGRESRRYCPKEDSENQARRYLVEVDQHIGGGGGDSLPPFLPRHREALWLTKSRTIKGSNPITRFNTRRPVDGPRDQQRSRVHNNLQGKPGHLLNKPGLSSRRRGHSRHQPHNPKPIEKKHLSERNPAITSSASTGEIPLITVEGLPPESPPFISSQQQSSPIRKEVREDEEEEGREENNPGIVHGNDEGRNSTRAKSREKEPKAIFTVTVRTTPQQQQQHQQQQQSSGTQLQYSKLERSREPSILSGTQKSDLWAISSAHVSLTTAPKGNAPPNPASPPLGRTTCRRTAPSRSLQLLTGRRYTQRHQRSDVSNARYIAQRSGITPQSTTKPHGVYTYPLPAESKALVVQQFQLTLPFDQVFVHCEGSAYNTQCLSPVPLCGTSASSPPPSEGSSRSDIRLRPHSPQPEDMANETETQQNMTNSQVNGQVKHMKGYRKKGLVSEKVLLERLSDMSIEDDILNPVITLSSVEDDDDSPMEEGSPKPSKKGTLKKSLSLAVPSLNLAEEPKRPPL